MKKIICRADGNTEVGLGHLYRMFALYEMYRAYSDILLLTREDTPQHVIPEGYSQEKIPQELSVDDEPKWIAESFASSEYMMIADGYQFDGQYQKKIISYGFFLMYVDDLAKENMYANIVVNHALGFTKASYTTQEYTLLALGTQYAILRPRFLEAAKAKRKIFRINSVFVCFGGADQYNLSLLAVKALQQFDQITTIHVVLGAANQHQALFDLAKEDNKLRIHQNIDENKMLAVMESCQFAIAPSSTILYELCSVKMAILSGYFIENQTGIYQAFSKNNIIYSGGDFSKYTEQDFSREIKKILTLERHDELVANQSRLFDAKIKERFLSLLLPVSFRKATIEDADLLFEWANDEVVRNNSYASEAIDYDTHKKWFTAHVNDEKKLFLIARHNQKAIGLVRYTIEKDHAVVGVSIAKEARGKKLASSMLMLAAKYYFKTNSSPIFAYIKKSNKASIHSFKRAGYAFLRQEEIKGHPSVVYQLQKI